jgi:DNA repair exonuclease SbcCD ATPase subunit
MNARRDLYAELMAGGPHSPDRSEKASALIDAFAAEARVHSAEPREAPAHGKLWSLLDWSFWGAGMGDVFRMPLADRMLAAVPAETIAQAEAVMADFIERRNIEKTGVTIYQEQRDELKQARARIAELEAEVEQLTEASRLFLNQRQEMAEERYAWQERGDRAETRVRELEAERKRYVGVEPTIAEEMAYLSRCIDSVLELCDKAEEQASRWEQPIPVPEWVAPVRAAAEGLVERRAYPPALPWAHLMDGGDLSDFLAELEHAIATPGATPDEALAAVEEACGTWRLIAEAQHAHNTAPGPNAETGEGR